MNVSVAKLTIVVMVDVLYVLVYYLIQLLNEFMISSSTSIIAMEYYYKLYGIKCHYDQLYRIKLCIYIYIYIYHYIHM